MKMGIELLGLTLLFCVCGVSHLLDNIILDIVTFARNFICNKGTYKQEGHATKTFIDAEREN